MIWEREQSYPCSCKEDSVGKHSCTWFPLLSKDFKHVLRFKPEYYFL